MNQVKSTNKALKLSLLVFAGIVVLATLYLYLGRIKYFKDTARHALVNDFFQEAEWRYHEVLKLNPFSFEAKLGLAHALQLQGGYKEAKPLYEEALDIRRRTLGTDHPDVAETLNNLGAWYYSQGDYAEAKTLFKQALVIWERTLGPDHPNVKTLLNNMNVLYQKAPDPPAETNP